VSPPRPSMGPALIRVHLYGRGVMAGTLSTAGWLAACFSHQMAIESATFGKNRKRLAGGRHVRTVRAKPDSGPA
jgi:hypothetical protein